MSTPDENRARPPRRPSSRPGPFEWAAANLAKKWDDDGLGARSPWHSLSAERKTRYLAGFAAAYGVSFPRFLRAAEVSLGVRAPTREQQRRLRQQFEEARDWQGLGGKERQRRALPSETPPRDGADGQKPGIRGTLRSQLEAKPPQRPGKGKAPKRQGPEQRH